LGRGGNYPGTLLTAYGPSVYRGYLRAPEATPTRTRIVEASNAVKGIDHSRPAGRRTRHGRGIWWDDVPLRPSANLVVNTSNWWLGHQVLVSPRMDSGCETGPEATVNSDLDRTRPSKRHPVCTRKGSCRSRYQLDRHLQSLPAAVRIGRTTKSAQSRKAARRVVRPTAAP